MSSDVHAALFEQLARLVSQYSAATSAADADRVTQAYHQILRRLQDANFHYALGEALELPDDRLPADYVLRRTRILSALESKLCDAARSYRNGQSDEEKAHAISEYHALMDEMYRIGHWVGVPDEGSELPYELMPESYKRKLKELLRQYSRGFR
jgi:hypothetical protein